MGRRVAVFSSTSQPPDRLSYKIFKMEYRMNRLLDLPQILNISLGDLKKIKNGLKGRQPSMEDDLKHKDLNISETTDWIFLKFQTEA